MKNIINLLCIIFLFSVNLNAQTSHFYYYKGQKIDLTVNKEYVHIIADKDFLQSSNSSRLFGELGLEQDKKREVQGLIKLKFRSKSDVREYSKTVDLLKQNRNVKHILPFYERNGADPIGTSDIFYLKLKETVDSDMFRKIAERVNVQIIKQVPCMPLWYIMSMQNSSFENPVEAANYFYETGYFEDVDPAFMFDFNVSCTNDPGFGDLWGLKNTAYNGIDINVCNAWTITRGNGVNVAVVDQGIQPDHNDLTANFHPLSFNAQTGTSPSVYSYHYHGTHVAGIVAAVKDNNLQVVGVAPESKIMRVSHDLFITPTFSAELASGISWAWQNGADVITNSWGDQGGTHYGTLYSSVLENAITDAMTLGRGGKGCVVVFAAGNYGLNDRVDYPGNFHNDILVAGSIDINGYRSDFSNYGDKLDVVAPGSHILSTMPDNETEYLTGTSMAAPHAAGVAALVLSVDPTLTGLEVRNIMETTAKKINQSYSPNSVMRPNGLWAPHVGYGLIDAYAAVNWKKPIVCTTPTYYFTNQSVSTDTVIDKCDVFIQNVNVINNASLKVINAASVTIDSNFEVKSGSKFEVN